MGVEPQGASMHGGVFQAGCIRLVAAGVKRPDQVDEARRRERMLTRRHVRMGPEIT